MGTLLLAFIIFGAVAGIDLPGIFKKRQWKELVVFITFYTLGFTIVLFHLTLNFDLSFVSAWFINVFSLW